MAAEGGDPVITLSLSDDYPSTYSKLFMNVKTDKPLKRLSTGCIEKQMYDKYKSAGYTDEAIALMCSESVEDTDLEAVSSETGYLYESWVSEIYPGNDFVFLAYAVAQNSGASVATYNYSAPVHVEGGVENAAWEDIPIENIENFNMYFYGENYSDYAFPEVTAFQRCGENMLRIQVNLAACPVFVTWVTELGLSMEADSESVWIYIELVPMTISGGRYPYMYPFESYTGVIGKETEQTFICSSDVGYFDYNESEEAVYGLGISFYLTSRNLEYYDGECYGSGSLGFRYRY